MAKQKGILPIEGTVGNITFYKSADGYLVREKGGVPGDRIAGDPRFQRTRENMAEFGRAGRAGKQLRTALRPIMPGLSDRKMVSRLTQTFMAVIKSDPINPRGQRLPEQGNLGLLVGFDFNVASGLDTTLFAVFQPQLNRGTGAHTITIDGFVPRTMVVPPEGATHFRLVAAAVALNFDTNEAEIATQATTEMPIDNNPLPQQLLTCSLSAGSTNPLFMVLGIQFYQMVNGQVYPLLNGAFNALRIVAAEA
jgi:hypothetical protein